MRRPTRNVAFAAALAAAPAILAHDSDDAPGATIGEGGMMGMMSMMGQAGRMMDHCGQMMGGTTRDHGSGRPNEQWRREAPAAPPTDR